MMNTLSATPAPPQSWSRRVENAVLLDALVQRAADLQETGGCQHGASIYGNGLNLTLSVDKTRGTTSPVTIAGTFDCDDVELQVESTVSASVKPAEWQPSSTWRVHGTYGETTVVGAAQTTRQSGQVAERSMSFGADALHLTDSKAIPVDAAGPDVASADMEELLHGMKARGYDTVVDTHGDITMDGTTVPMERLVFTAPDLPTVMEYRIGGSRAEITVQHSHTRMGTQERYIGNIDGNAFNIVEQEREFSHC